MQAKNDDDLDGGQRSSEVKWSKLCDIATIFGQKKGLSNSFAFYPFLKCSMSHTSFSSLPTRCSFYDNSSHMLLFKS